MIQLPLLFINISYTFIDASAGARHLSHGCVATLEKRENCLRVAPCREPNEKLSLVAFERFTTLEAMFGCMCVPRLLIMIGTSGCHDSFAIDRVFVVAASNNANTVNS